MSNQESNSCCSGIFLPVSLLAASLLVFFIWQLTMLTSQHSALGLSLQQLEESFKNNTPQHEQMIKQSQAVQAKLEKIANGLLKLAEDGDPDAKALIAKFKISRSAPAASPAPAK